MFSKLSLMILTTLVSLSSYCQYPMTKVFGQDTVVIMTLKQGQEINKQFSILKDSLQYKEMTIQNSKIELKKTNKLFNDSLISMKKNILSLEKENIHLKEEYVRVQKQIWVDRRERRFTAGGILFAVLGWCTFFALAK